KWSGDMGDVAMAQLEEMSYGLLGTGAMVGADRRKWRGGILVIQHHNGESLLVEPKQVIFCLACKDCQQVRDQTRINDLVQHNRIILLLAHAVENHFVH